MSSKGGRPLAEGPRIPGPEARALLAIGALLAILLLAPAAVVGAEARAFVAERPGVVAAVEAAAGPVCHHFPERTLTVADRYLPVCARCTGLYGGLAAGGPLGLLVGGLVASSRRGMAIVAGGAVLLTTVAGVAAILEAVGALATGNPLRVVLGVPLGLGPALIAGLGARLLIREGRT